MYNLEVADNHNYFADGVLVSNCHYFKRLGFPTRMDGFSVEASKRATDLALKHVGRAVPNVPMLAGFAAITGVIALPSLVAAIRQKFPAALAEKNVAAATEAFETASRAKETTDA